MLLLSACAQTPPKPTIAKPKPPGTGSPAASGAASGATAPGTAAVEPERKPAEPPFRRADFTDLPDWDTQDFTTAYLNFKNQCPQVIRRKASSPDLRKICDGLVNSKKPEKLTARQWFETKFDVWQVVQEDGQTQGLLTGYFEPMLKGSRQKQGNFKHPLFPVPGDLITVELADVYPSLKGMRLRGRLEGNKLVAYPNRGQWETIGERKTEPLVYVDDALDAFLLQVQGSGRIELEGGQTVRLGYADQNGHPYVAIGKVLVNRGVLTAEEATIPGIRKWAAQNPKDLPALLNENPSVVFFKETALTNPNEGPNGSLGVPLVPEGSIAIDPNIISLGSPVFVNSEHPLNKSAFNRLVLAQDTGGAIRGRVRADMFWGWGSMPAELAGVTRQPLKMWMLWPKGVVPGG